MANPLLPPHPPRPKGSADGRPGVYRRDPIRAQDRHRLGRPAGRDGLRQRRDLLVVTALGGVLLEALKLMQRGVVVARVG